MSVHSLYTYVVHLLHFIVTRCSAINGLKCVRISIINGHEVSSCSLLVSQNTDNREFKNHDGYDKKQ